MIAKLFCPFFVLVFVPATMPGAAQNQKEVGQETQLLPVQEPDQNSTVATAYGNHDASTSPAIANATNEGAGEGAAQPDAANKNGGAGMEIYGHVMLDMIYDFGVNSPDWSDVMRPTQLPSFANEYGKDNNFYADVKQTKFGMKTNFPTPLGEMKTRFEFDLFGTGADAGQTTFHLLHAWGELGKFGGGRHGARSQTTISIQSSIEYWGPSGMALFRNVQVRYMPINHGNHQLWFALERPGASADLGVLANRIQLQNVKSRFPAPDFSGRFRWGGERGYLQVAGVLRYMAWDDTAPTATRDLSGDAVGGGFNISLDGSRRHQRRIEVVHRVRTRK